MIVITATNASFYAVTSVVAWLGLAALSATGLATANRRVHAAIAVTAMIVVLAGVGVPLYENT